MSGVSHSTTFQRWADKVRVGDGCWEWTASTYPPYGYGMFSVQTSDGKWRPVRAHRASYELFVGDIPEGMFVCHSCDNPGCVKPSHLFIGSHEDNMADMFAKGRSKRGRPQPSVWGEQGPGHKLTEGEVLAITARLDAGESQQAIADDIGMGQSQISRIHRGKSWGWLTGRAN